MQKKKKIYNTKFIIGDFVAKKFSNGLIFFRVVDLERDENDLSCKSAVYVLKPIFSTKKLNFYRRELVKKVDNTFILIKPETFEILFNSNK